MRFGGNQLKINIYDINIMSSLPTQHTAVLSELYNSNCKLNGELVYRFRRGGRTNGTAFIVINNAIKISFHASKPFAVRKNMQHYIRTERWFSEFKLQSELK